MDVVMTQPQLDQILNAIECSTMSDSALVMFMVGAALGVFLAFPAGSLFGMMTMKAVRNKITGGNDDD